MVEKQADCGLSAALRMIGGKWKIDILCALSASPRRFGRLRQMLPGISEKVLSQHLREMSEDGLVIRQAYDQTPPKVVYSLTESGRGLARSVTPLCTWGEAHLRDEQPVTA